MFPLPTPANMLSAIGTWADPFFQEYLPMIYYICGILIGGMLVAWIGNIIINAVSNYFEGKHENEYHEQEYSEARFIEVDWKKLG